MVHKPSNPNINGPSYGFKGIEYTFTASSFHVDGINISYFFDWGDETNSGWTDFEQPGIPVNASHKWIFEGDSKRYTIRVKAKDINNVEGDWSTFPVGMPKSYIHNPILNLLTKIVKCFTFFEKILNQMRL